MDRFLDEEEGGSSLSSAYPRDPPGVHTLLYGRCPSASGVAPPITPSTLASATIAFVAAKPDDGDDDEPMPPHVKGSPPSFEIPPPQLSNSASLSSDAGVLSSPPLVSSLGLNSSPGKLEAVSLSPKASSTIVHPPLSNGIPQAGAVAL